MRPEVLLEPHPLREHLLTEVADVPVLAAVDVFLDLVRGDVVLALEALEDTAAVPLLDAVVELIAQCLLLDVESEDGEEMANEGRQTLETGTAPVTRVSDALVHCVSSHPRAGELRGGGRQLTSSCAVVPQKSCSQFSQKKYASLQCRPLTLVRFRRRHCFMCSQSSRSFDPHRAAGVRGAFVRVLRVAGVVDVCVALVARAEGERTAAAVVDHCRWMGWSVKVKRTMMRRQCVSMEGDGARTRAQRCATAAPVAGKTHTTWSPEASPAATHSVHSPMSAGFTGKIQQASRTTSIRFQAIV